MQEFANSTVPGTIKISVQPLVFWSSGVLSLAMQPQSSKTELGLPGTDFTYIVEVHDSEATATVQIATDFRLLHPLWNYPCQKSSAVYVLGTVNKPNGELMGQFGDKFQCDMWLSTPIAKQLSELPGAKAFIPSKFDTQVDLPPGRYELRVVVSDGKNFGRARAILQVQPLHAEEVTLSDIALNSVVRNASWVLRDATSFTPAPIIPTPLVSKNAQFLPVADTQLSKGTPLSVYFEIYEPLLETNKADVFYSLRITDLKAGALVMNTGPMSAADWVTPGNAVVPIGLKLDLDKFGSSSYRLEVQASDSTGRQSKWQEAHFNVD